MHTDSFEKRALHDPVLPSVDPQAKTFDTNDHDHDLPRRDTLPASHAVFVVSIWQNKSRLHAPFEPLFPCVCMCVSFFGRFHAKGNTCMYVAARSDVPLLPKDTQSLLSL